ncbi:Chaperone protein HtpG [Candidatus Arsenophonus lipoptenae]|uniref:Chaperone protein HtpG n=2 Tax=Morganellaceae TaxID=1903414 RepID=A0A109QEJ4_9GAMM|nr:Chaperone protein HtpG [Candidatus Arsenophonus lipoptenae]
MKEQEIRGFQSEVKQLLQLMIHSLYSNKEIFLRELISNASDAADKLRFKALSKSDLYENDGDLKVRISIDKDKKLLSITDNGIGMTRTEVIDNLGTIAQSGTKTFLKSLGKDKAKDSQLIGQFGVGFYSVFIVADQVTVRTRSAGNTTDKGVFWQSYGEGEYTIADIEKIDRGTEIILHLREDQSEFLDTWRLRSIISKYSDHITLPIEIANKNEKNGIITWEKINKSEAIWTRNKKEISDKEYKEFYKNISHDYSDPLIWIHNKVEGKQEYINLLYIPTKAPVDLWNRDNKNGLKLYVHRVFIMDQADQFMPHYLRFIRGVVDCNDLPLNISREVLQDSDLVKNLRISLTKRILQILEKLSKKDIEKYQKFWNEFGLVLKEGIAEDTINKKTISRLLRFSSTYNNNNIQNVSLEDYINRIVNGNQKKIYYITADNYISAKNSPHLELFRKKGIEVLLLSDRIDEWMMNYLPEFEGKSFQSISKIDESLEKLTNEDKEKQIEIDKQLRPFIQRVKNTLGDQVKEVKLTYRLTETPAIVTTDANDMSTQMAKLFSVAGQATPELKYNFELNPEHPLVQKTIKITDDKLFFEWIKILLDQALFIEKGSLDNPNEFIDRMNKLFLS